MIVPGYIRRAIHAWEAWRRRCRLYRVIPAMRDLDVRERKARQAHHAVEPIRAARRELLRHELERELGRA